MDLAQTSTTPRLIAAQDIDSRIVSLINLVKLPQVVHTLAGYLPKSRITKIIAATGKKDVRHPGSVVMRTTDGRRAWTGQDAVEAAVQA